MTSKKEAGVDAVIERKQTILVTADMVIDVYLAYTKEVDKLKKKEYHDTAILLSQHLNEYLPLKKSQYIIP